MVLEKFGRRHQLVSGICPSELWGRLARTQGVLRRRNLSATIENQGDKQASNEDAERAKYGPADFTAVVLLVAKSPLEADGEQCSAEQKQSVVKPMVRRAYLQTSQGLGCSLRRTRQQSQTQTK